MHPANFAWRRIQDRLSRTTGSIDLASIMVGVIIIAIISAILSATVFIIIPWAQDNAAKQNLDAVRTAESVYRAQSPAVAYTDSATLVGAHQLQASPKVVAAASPDGSCYVGVSTSDTGHVFWNSSENPTVRQYKTGDTSDCPGVDLGTLVPAAPVASGYIAVAGGNMFSLALDHNGTVWTAGYDYDGQVSADGVGAPNYQKPLLSPISIPAKITQIAAGDSTSYALDDAGHYWAWGSEQSGQIGDGNTWTDVTTPTEVTPNATYKKVVGADSAVLLLDTSGHLWGSGQNSYSEVGTGDSNEVDSLTAIAPGTTFADVAAGDNFEMALDTTGHLWEWGTQFAGELGNGNSSNVLATPTEVDTTDTFASIAASGNTGYALSSSGQLFAWGANDAGQTGNNDSAGNSVLTPTAVAGAPHLAQIAAGKSHALGIDTSGHLYTWGDNTYGQLGDNNAAPNALAPEAIDSTLTFGHIAGGDRNSLAIDSSGNLYIWGDNSNGQVGIGGLTTKPIATPHKVDGSVDSTMTFIPAAPTLGPDITLPNAVFNTPYTGQVPFSGQGATVELPNGTVAPGLSMDSAGVITGTPTASGSFAFQVKATNAGGSTTRTFLIRVTRQYTQVANGVGYTLALDSNGHLWAWGINDRHQLGDGTTTDQALPEEITPAQTYSKVAVSSVSPSGAESYAIDTSGQLWAWGYPGNGGTLGTAAGANTVPRPVNPGVTYAQVATSDNATLAIDTAGRLWGWGDDDFGQLGDRPNLVSTQSDYNPTLINNGHQWAQVSVGQAHTLAIDTAGHLYAWGYNGNGQLGNGTTTDSATPVQVAPGTLFSTASAGWRQSTAVDTLGNLWTWGENSMGQLGDGTTTQHNTPEQILPGTKFVESQTGWNLTSALSTDGAIYAAGDETSYVYGAVYGAGTTYTTLSMTEMAYGPYTQAAVTWETAVGLDKNGNAQVWGASNRLGANISSYDATMPSYQ